ncbi:MAG: sugar phosphate isomerase/epimerase [Spirochaetes bacterium]|nr:sugar phosphate isomerase/epimerase [Spirochaetota bacterium]
MAVKLSIGTWAYTFGRYADNPISMEEVAKKLAELGFDGLSLGGFKPHGHPDLYPKKKDRKKLMKLFKSHGLAVNSYAADMWSFPFAAAGAEAARKYEDAFDSGLEMCVDCGIPIIRVDTVTQTPYPKDFEYDRAWDDIVGMFKKITSRAKKEGVLVVWEFEPGYIFNKPSEIVKMVKDVADDNFKLQTDTCHVQMCAVQGTKQWGKKEVLPGGQKEFFDMVKGMVGDVHIIDSDNTLHDDHTSTHAPFGEGVINFEDVIPAIRKAGYDSEWWTIDLCFWPNAWEITEASKRYLDSLFPKLGMK